LASRIKSFADKGAEIIALSKQDMDGAKRTAAKIPEFDKVADMKVLADPDGSVAKAWKLVAANGVINPATFIINQERKVIWRYVGKTITDNPQIYMISDNLP